MSQSPKLKLRLPERGYKNNITATVIPGCGDQYSEPNVQRVSQRAV